MDRIDLHVEVPAVPYRDLKKHGQGESSTAIRHRVMSARAVQNHRFRRTQIHCNAQMNSRQIRTYCSLTEDSSRLLEAAIDRFGLSARAYNRILKIARTIADLSFSDAITAEHVSEAVQHRHLDRA